MKRLIAAIFVVAMSMIIPQIANAQSFTIKSGQTVLISTPVGWTGRCRTTGYARVVITKKPRRGRVTVRRGRFPIPGKVLSGKAGRCAGKKIRGVGIYYTAPRNFRGRVSIRFKAKQARGGRFYTQRHTVRVR